MELGNRRAGVSAKHGDMKTYYNKNSYRYDLTEREQFLPCRYIITAQAYYPAFH